MTRYPPTTNAIQDQVRARYAAGLMDLDKALGQLQHVVPPRLTRSDAAYILRQPISADSVLQITSREVSEHSIRARLAAVTATVPRADIHTIGQRYDVDYDLDFDPTLEWVRATAALLRHELDPADPAFDGLLAAATELDALADRYDQETAA